MAREGKLFTIKNLSLVDLILFYIPCDVMASMIGIASNYLELNNIFYDMEIIVPNIRADSLVLANVYLR